MKSWNTSQPAPPTVSAKANTKPTVGHMTRVSQRLSARKVAHDHLSPCATSRAISSTGPDVPSMRFDLSPETSSKNG